MSCTERDFTCAVRPGTESAVTQPTVTASACPGIIAIMGPQTLTQSPGGCVTVERTSYAVADGTYTNATVTMRDGYITAITQGAAVLQAVTPLCTTMTSAGTPTTSTAAIAVNPDPANLSSYAGNQLSTFVFASGTRGVDVTGTGTAADPIVVKGPLLPAIPTITGVTTAAYGITFTDGLAKTWVPPLMGLTTTADSGITLTPDALTGKVALSLTPVSTTGVAQTTYAEPVGVAYTFIPNSSDTGFLERKLHVFGRPDTNYSLQWKSRVGSTNLPAAGGTSFTTTTDSTGVALDDLTQTPMPGLYAVVRSISGTPTTVAYVTI